MFGPWKRSVCTSRRNQATGRVSQHTQRLPDVRVGRMLTLMRTYIDGQVPIGASVSAPNSPPAVTRSSLDQLQAQVHPVVLNEEDRHITRRIGVATGVGRIVLWNDGARRVNLVT
jgi:hypothetical protein